MDPGQGLWLPKAWTWPEQGGEQCMTGRCTLPAPLGHYTCVEERSNCSPDGHLLGLPAPPTAAAAPCRFPILLLLLRLLLLLCILQLPCQQLV